MKKKLIDIILVASSFFYKYKTYKTPQGHAMANLGCGLRCLPNWLNVDGSPSALLYSKRLSFINRILYTFAGSSEFYTFTEYNEILKKNKLLFYDLRMGIPFKDNSLDVVFASHFLEHLSNEDGKKFLAECRRVLKPGGLIRILVPDLDFAFALYSSGKTDEMLRSFFYTSDRFDFHAHKYGYNFESLKKRLEKLDFKDIKKLDFKIGECPDIDYLDIYPGHSLFVECRKQ